jgi:transglutaminase-like putative cysteine protease
VIKRKGKPETSSRSGGETSAWASLVTGLASRLRDWRPWLNVVLLFAVLEIAVLSLEQARWIQNLPSLTMVLILAMLVVWLLARTRLPGFLLHILALVVGALFTYGLLHGRLAGGGTDYFAIFLVYLVWLIGYIATWAFLRRKNAWVAVCLGALVILVNLSNLPGRYYYYFGLYFVAAVFLIVQTRLSGRQVLPERGNERRGRGLYYFLAPLLCLVVLAVTVSWIIPEARFPQLQTAIATRILWKKDIEKSPFNIFAVVPSKQPLVTSSMIQELPFENAWHRGDRIDFVVSSELPAYWQVHVYDTYTSQGWTNRPGVEYLLEKGAPRSGTVPTPGSHELTYKVITGMKTNEIITTGDLVSSKTPVMVHESGGDIVSLTAPRLFGVGESYTVTVAVSQATREELSRAGDDIPPEILDAYLQLPPDFPDKVRELSADITAHATSPFQKVLAIRGYLSRIPYTTEVGPPPERVDGIEYFLFTRKTGFCIHFASAAVVMLRSVGVPARLAVGYLPGEPGEKEGEYILRDKFFHAWPQVYFPGYGWVDIEVTPTGSTAAGSEVTLETPWVSSENIANLPQWDIWQLMAMYGAAPPGGAGKVVPASEYPRAPRGPLPFADELGRALLIILILVFCALFLLTPLLLLRSAFHRWIWNVDRANLRLTTYAKLCRLGAMVKLGPRPHQTPAEYAAELSAEFPSQAKDLEMITRVYVENRFGRRRERPGLFEEAEILKARCGAFDALLSRLGPLEKLIKRL